MKCSRDEIPIHEEWRVTRVTQNLMEFQCWYISKVRPFLFLFFFWEKMAKCPNVQNDSKWPYERNLIGIYLTNRNMYNAHMPSQFHLSSMFHSFVMKIKEEKRKPLSIIYQCWKMLQPYCVDSNTRWMWNMCQGVNSSSWANRLVCVSVQNGRFDAIGILFIYILPWM